MSAAQDTYSDGPPVTALYMAVLELAERHGVTARGEGQVWQYQVDDDYQVLLNATARTVLGPQALRVPAAGCLVLYRGTAAALVELYHGLIVEGHEDPLIAALEAAGRRALS